MIQEFTSSPFYSGWPFWVLSLTPDASSQAVSQALQSISAQLKLGVEKARYFDTPMVVRERDEYLLREAKSILDNPDQRLIAELWFVPASNQATDSSDNEQPAELSVKLDWRSELKLP